MDQRKRPTGGVERGAAALRVGVRVRVRLGVGGAIRNYCGTIDKRRLRGCTTEDSFRPSDFLLFSFVFFLISFLLAYETDQTRQYVMLETPAPRVPLYVEWKMRSPIVVYSSGREV